jgi:DNA invertase Pin-like site-specific DNA recombinase
MWISGQKIEAFAPPRSAAGRLLFGGVVVAYCIYLRKSRTDAEAEERGEGETLARHERALLELARRQSLNVTQIYREIVSGETIAARPVMQKLLTEVERGLWEGVLVMEVERLARGDTIDQGIMAQTFKFSETRIVTPMKTYNPNDEFDEEYFEFGLFMSRREYKTINRRLQRGRLASVKEGKYVASRPPYGYNRVKLEKEKGFTLVPESEKAEVVRLIFSLYVTGETAEDGSLRRLGIDLIAKKLNQMHINPAHGDYWTKASIRDILINPVYIGKIRWKWRANQKKMIDGKTVVERPRNFGDDCVVADGLHPAIVDKTVFDLAQELIAESPPAPIGRRREIVNPFAGLIVCGKCGKNMVFRKGYSRSDYLVCYRKSCDNASAPFHLVEKGILSALRRWLGECRLTWRQDSGEDGSSALLTQKALKKVDGELALLGKQLNTTHDLLEQGVYTTEQFLDRSRSLAERIEQAKADRAALKKELGVASVQEESRRAIIPRIEKLLEVYEALPTAADKNELLKEVVEKVIYTKQREGSGRGGDPEKFSLDLFPKLPQLAGHDS